ncbi:MAG: adenylate/guanylate cyclase domain-containing protein [Phycisphaerales bacterium]
MSEDPAQPGTGSPAAPPDQPPWPTGRVTIIFTDIQGSTSLWEKLKEHFAPILDLHNRIIREAIDLCRGYEVKTVGDAFMIAFADALDALRCAVLMQELLTSQKWPESSGEILVRVGMHTGEPIADVNPQTARVDYFGPMVNMSARVESAAHGAQILLSGATHAEVASRLAESDLGSIELADLGEHRLKGIDSPERIFQVISPRLPHRDFPPIATLTTLPTNLPYQQSTFVGREREIDELTALLTDPKVRAVTLTGPGGTGKTRLSLRLGNVLLDKFEGGVWVANLARAQTAEDVSAAVAAALGLQLSGGEAPERVVANVLEYRKPLLLILDNFEQVAQHSAKTVGLWMTRAPKVKFLVTSQAVLALAGETEYRLGPLGVPPREEGESAAHLLGSGGALAAAATFDSVKLFVERAREAMPAFNLTEENSRDVMRICAELDGIPLAIELAAARVKIMSPAQMVQRLTQKFQLLRSTRRDIPERHQTLNAAIEWSFDLLSDWEKAAFEQACIFRGGFSLEAAEAVIDLTAHPDAPFPMDAVQMLREKSLLTSRDTPQGVRFHMFRAMREWGEGKFKPDSALIHRHAEYYTHYATHWEALRVGPRMAEALDALDLKKDNILAAIDRSITSGNLARAAEAAVALAPTLGVRTAGAQRAASAEAVLKAADAAGEAAIPAEPRVRLLVALSRARQSLGEAAAAEELAARAAAVSASLGTSIAHADALTNHAEALRRASRLDDAMALHERALVICRQAAGAPAQLTLARNQGGKGMIHQNWGQHKEALAAFEEAEALNRKLGNIGGLAANLNNRGRLLRDMGQMEESIACFAEAEKLSRSIGDTAVTATIIANRHATLQATGDVKAALVCCVQAERVFRELGDKANMARCIGKRGSALAELGRLDEAAEVLTTACTMLRELGQKRSVAALTSNLALVYVQQQKFPLAKAAAEEFVEFCRANKYIISRDAFDGHVTLVNALLGLGDAHAARAAARRALQLVGMLKIHERKQPGMDDTLARLTEIARAGSG